MISRWIACLNYVLVGLSFLLILIGGVYWLNQPREIICTDPLSKQCGLPKGAFELPEEAYQQLGEYLLNLEQAPPHLQLPDLKSHLIYYGKNSRPDAQADHSLFHLSISGNKGIVSMSPGEKIYLFYDRSLSPGRYNFSPNNEKTSLWIEGTPLERELQVKVTMEDEKGEKIVEPAVFAEFRLAEKEFNRQVGSSFEIGSFRVDGTLFARQKARWYGPDRFLEQHGGEEFQNILGRQRVDFGENNDIYSVFVTMGDCLIWNDNCWKVVEPGNQSLQHPLLVVKKVDDRLMAFELWDAEGKGKVALNLLKSSEPWNAQNSQTLQHTFKFLGAKTKTQCVFEINRERVILRPSDWLLFTPKGWKRLSTEEEIDNYVKRKVSGMLFVFEGVLRKDEKQMMIGKLYSPSRHEFQAIEVPLQTKGSKPTSTNGKDTKETKKEDPAGNQQNSTLRSIRSNVIP